MDCPCCDYSCFRPAISASPHSIEFIRQLNVHCYDKSCAGMSAGKHVYIPQLKKNVYCSAAYTGVVKNYTPKENEPRMQSVREREREFALNRPYCTIKPWLIKKMRRGTCSKPIVFVTSRKMTGLLFKGSPAGHERWLRQHVFRRGTVHHVHIDKGGDNVEYIRLTKKLHN